MIQFILIAMNFNASLAEQIELLLPQTQCRQCGFQGCKPYAEAISLGNADINQCPPGGEQGIKQLADLLNIPVKALNTEFGIDKPFQVAVIVEADCIGCTRCLPPCPVDAIIGASKQMHTVVAQQCTGCELCLAHCPVDCIVMQEPDMPKFDPMQARKQHQVKNERLAKFETEKVERLNRQKMLLAKLRQAKS
ncbi:MAG: RnfABCDGE type electron transport complex subunit B [Methylomonas sp.]